MSSSDCWLDALAALVGGGVVRLDALVEHGGDVLERRHRDLDRRAEHDFGGTNGGRIGGVGDRQAVAAVRRTHREDRGLAQEAPGEAVEAWRRSEQLRQAQPHHAQIVGNFVGEFGGGQIGRFPQFAKRSRQG